MELMAMVTTFICIVCLSILITAPSCVSLRIQDQSSSHERARAQYVEHFSLPTLPRKLRLLEQVVNVKVEGYEGNQSSTSIVNKLKEDTSGKARHKEQITMDGGRRHEWMEGTDDTSEYFTMDYSHVKRRRPIHNKSLPVGP